MNEIYNLINEVCSDNIQKVVISNKISKDNKYNKIMIMQKENSKGVYYQIEKYTDKQVFHENIDTDIFVDRVIENFFEKYKQLNAWSYDYTYDLKVSKKGKVHLSKKKESNSGVSIK